MKTSLKLQRKALYELKIASKLITERDRRRELELKIKAIEKLLDKAEDKVGGLPVNEVSSPQLTKEFVRFEQISTKSKSHSSSSFQSEPARERKPYDSGSGQSLFQGKVFDGTSSVGFAQRVMYVFAGLYSKLKYAFRKSAPESFSRGSSDTHPTNRKPPLSS
ncbi:hypothetical protein [Chloroherpeton thalassium]|uniref:hypothetical protein n=1 Tax=Chloroherpeton thalassium TaxID=100716 RepID=UPI00145EA34A|nr:hypothetical protein [Chloroherpeton thalassium]